MVSMLEHASQRRLRWQTRALALIAVALAGMCVFLAVAWSRAHREAQCWRAAVESDELPATANCAGPALSK